MGRPYEPRRVAQGLEGHDDLDAKRRNVDVDVATFPFMANGRAMTMDEEAGFVRIVCRKQDGLIVGVQAFGEGVSELSAAVALAIEMGATARISPVPSTPIRREARRFRKRLWEPSGASCTYEPASRSAGPESSGAIRAKRLK